MFDWLLWRDLEGKLVPGIASKWESTADGLSVTLTLRDGMVFHNGDRITAGDVKFSIERFLLPDSLGTGAGQWRTFLNNVETPNAATVIIRFKQPWYVVLVLLAPPDQTIGVVLPKAGIDRLGEKEFFNNRQYGSGPWKFVDHRTSVSFTYEAWEQKHPFRLMPEFKTLHILLIGEESTRVAMLRTGAANLATVSPDTAKNLQRAGFVVHKVIQGSQTRFLFWGLENSQALEGKPTVKKEVRQALSLAVDRQAVIDTLLGGLTTIAPRDVVNIGMEGYDPNWKPFPYDPARAKQILAQAGYPNGGFTVDLYNPALPAAPWTPRAGEAIASYWEAIGVRVRVIPIEYGGFRPLFRQYPHQTLAGAWGWLPGAVGETSGLIYAQWHAKGASQRISVPEIDALIDRVPQQADPAERVRLIREVSERTYQLWISIPVAYDVELYVGGPDVGAWDPLILPPGFAWERIKRKGN